MSAINLSEVLKLPVQERIRIVEAIWDSVAEHPEQVELLPWQAVSLIGASPHIRPIPLKAFPERRSNTVSSVARDPANRFPA